ncbi:hypothetical protein EU546_07815 [Candidatus Thorarchaeota archaeon]|nr:MAG: hypothetical protein EU546_07815 [Candidatus Thorarchaeota archaeon]
MNDPIQRILSLLKDSSDAEAILVPDPHDVQILEQLGARDVGEGQWQIERDDRLDLAMAAVRNGAEVEQVVKVMNWKDFEGLVARVLDENGYRYAESFRRRGTDETEGMEIDVVGVKGHRVLSLDAKMWGIRAGKTSALASAAEKQSRRTERLKNELERIEQKIGTLEPGEYSLIPALVTWLVEDIQFHEGVPIVPIFKLNAFLLELDAFEQSMLSYKLIVRT